MPRRNRVEDLEPIIPDDDFDRVGKYGIPKKYDPAFRGPVKARSCTDIICCLLFLSCIGGLGFVGYIAWSSGDPSSLLHPTDYRGQVCGRDEAVQDKPFLYYFDYLACADLTTLLEFTCATPQVCVSKCPDYVYFPYAETTIQFLPSQSSVELDWSKLICDYGFDPQEEYSSGGYLLFLRPKQLNVIFLREIPPLISSIGSFNLVTVKQDVYGLERMFTEGKCAAYYLPQSEYKKRCVPSFVVSAGNSSQDNLLTNNLTDLQNISLSGEFHNATALQDALSRFLSVYLEIQNVFEVIYEDIVASWHVILIGLFIGKLLATLYIIVMRWFAGVIVWSTVLILNGALVAVTGYCFYYWKYLESIEGSNRPLELTTNILSLLRTRSTWLILGCVFGAITTILLVLTLCLCQRIRIAIALIKEASRAVSHMLSSLFWPIIPFFLEVIVVCLWMGIAVFLATSHTTTYNWVYSDTATGEPVINGTECSFKDVNQTADDDDDESTRCQFSDYALPDYFIYLQFYNLFMLFWLVNFVIALGQMTLAGAFASYYWAFTKPQDIPSLPVFKSLKQSLRYHLGSLAFGSLIIAIIQIIRIILEYVEKKLKGKANNKVVKYIIKCLKCVFWFLEKVMKIINKNAFIMIAIYGKNFCHSAKEAFFLLMRNIVRVAVVNKVTDFIILMGKLSVSVLVGVAAFCFYTERIPLVADFLPVPEVSYHWTPIVIICVGTYAIAWCFFSVYDMAVDTLFLCFLEDLERHDGSAEKPYFMSKALKNIVGKKN